MGLIPLGGKGCTLNSKHLPHEPVFHSEDTEHLHAPSADQVVGGSAHQPVKGNRTEPTLSDGPIDQGAAEQVTPSEPINSTRTRTSTIAVLLSTLCFGFAAGVGLAILILTGALDAQKALFKSTIAFLSGGG